MRRRLIAIAIAAMLLGACGDDSEADRAVSFEPCPAAGVESQPVSDDEGDPRGHGVEELFGGGRQVSTFDVDFIRREPWPDGSGDYDAAFYEVREVEIHLRQEGAPSARETVLFGEVRSHLCAPFGWTDTPGRIIGAVRHDPDREGFVEAWRLGGAATVSSDGDLTFLGPAAEETRADFDTILAAGGTEGTEFDVLIAWLRAGSVAS